MNEKEAQRHYAASALTGILASPTFSSLLLDVNRFNGDDVSGSARQLLEELAKVSWNIASQMAQEGRERGVIDP